MQQAITRSREDLAERWLQLYLPQRPSGASCSTPPLIGETAAAGSIMPSVDFVQRMFPLTLATLLAPDVNPFGDCRR